MVWWFVVWWNPFVYLTRSTPEGVGGFELVAWWFGDLMISWFVVCWLFFELRNWWFVGLVAQWFGGL